MSAERLHEVAFVWLLLLALIGLPVGATLAATGRGPLLLVVVIACGCVTFTLCGVLGDLAERKRRLRP